MIIIAGTIDFVSQEHRDGVVAAAAEMQQSTRDTEPGCIAYSFAADSSVSNRVQVYECWADQASLAAHFLHPNFSGMREILGRFERLGPSAVAKYRCDLSEPVYDADRRPRADFFTALNND
jgi:quinol monooxygenase YgiN